MYAMKECVKKKKLELVYYKRQEQKNERETKMYVSNLNENI